jgi:hypothetical protein
MVSCAAAATVVALAASCGGDGSDESATGSTSTAPPEATTTTPPTTVLTPEEEAEAAYLEVADTVMRLITTDPNPDDPELPRLLAEPALGTVRDSLTTMQAENHIVQRGPRTSQRVMSVTVKEPGLAIVRVCDVGNDTRVDRDDNSIVSEGLSTRVADATVILVDGRWKVSSIGTEVKLDGEVPCPE